MKKILLLWGIIGIVVLAACAPQAEPPQITCPVCECPNIALATQNPLVFVYVIDVGQGDSILIKSGETEMLIDCGSNGQGPNVISFLKEKNVGELEYLLITHADSDHLGGCDDVLREFKTHLVIDNGQALDTISYKEVMEVIDVEQRIIATKDSSWSIGPSQISVLQANNGLTDTNQNTIVTKLTYRHTNMLLTGDCDRDCEDLLLDKEIKSGILMVAHHGSKFGTSMNLLNKVNPDIGIISVGPNSYGHPAQETLDRLTQEKVLLYRTDIDGDITISLDGNTYEVT